jgi:hypothetical protein
MCLGLVLDNKKTPVSMRTFPYSGSWSLVNRGVLSSDGIVVCTKSVLNLPGKAPGFC